MHNAKQQLPRYIPVRTIVAMYTDSHDRINALWLRILIWRQPKSFSLSLSLQHNVIVCGPQNRHVCVFWYFFLFRITSYESVLNNKLPSKKVKKILLTNSGKKYTAWLPMVIKSYYHWGWFNRDGRNLYYIRIDDLNQTFRLT